MNTSCFGLVAAVALLIASDVVAAPRAVDIENRLRSAVNALKTQAASSAARLDVTVDQTPSGIVAGELGNCIFLLAGTAEIDKRIEWAERTLACLEVAEADFEMQRIAPDVNAQRAFTTSIRVAADIRQQAELYVKELNAERDFIGLKWGVGVGYSHGFDDIVDQAEIVDGVVRVKKDITEQPRIILEFHSYRWCHDKRSGDVPIEVGCGPFAAVVSSDDEVVSGVAAGWMYGWKTGTGADSQGWSVGIGVIVDSGGKKLGEGYVEGQPPPAGATSVFLKEETVASGLIFFTRTF
jgi:hypothetical protein